MSDRTRGSHAVYPGTFDPFTAGHRDVVERVRRLFDRVTVLVAVNEAKQPTATPEQRSAALRSRFPESWTTVTVTAWEGLTVAFCHEHQATVIVRGVRNAADLQHEHQLAAMNEALGIPTLLVPARPELATVSSTAARALRT
ncbi:putative pantetheine-phosphate adenylyltransferase [Actinoplanes missouriensis 431]|uniref:Pantetheine-phosphate adenylyltransferase n=1 Tax=Actinoplanes missouriensis (strain ATCC 14538 / DSM 43046 / CBS 188.64 / JCM 3121 / NBRC 102363 / NCIMB 12654 / NRRL B-3342 / UNCC 431) TaxID=512565 RepID=I0H5M6_ACTM4|nr:pantetheine-phosphate adenylyltransferase [Actinoplanes missouriensis]BAL88313.1 putative pantetheine-phosphate adenylyltransferase [Actinoplanes missouriensis 431]